SEIVTIPTTICIFAATDQHRRNTDSSACQLCLSVYICVSLWLLFCFCNQPYIRNSHLFVDSLAHVVDRKKSDGDASERFHFDAGLRNSVRGAFYLRAFVRRDDVDLDLAKRQSVTKRNQLRGLFGGLNAGNPRGREDVAFYHLVLRDQIECLALKPDFSHRNRRPDTGRVARALDHLRSAGSRH